MLAVIQRVKQSSVSVDNEVVASIGPGLLVLLGVALEDTAKDVAYLADKIPHLRIFEDDRRKMNRSLLDTGGSMLVVSQFTLLGDCRKGRRPSTAPALYSPCRPSFIKAARPEVAIPLYESFAARVRDRGVHVETGRFQAVMDVQLVNDGPVTLILESPIRPPHET